jgi:hypothetical protein
MLIERMRHHNQVKQNSLLYYPEKYGPSRFGQELTARGPSKDT